MQGLKEIEDTWSSLKFNVQRYTKGNMDRGHILGSLDDTIQLLDDNTMQLQGMSVSRFIGPFLGSVQKWEKCLAHISEVLDVSWIIFKCFVKIILANLHGDICLALEAMLLLYCNIIDIVINAILLMLLVV